MGQVLSLNPPCQAIYIFIVIMMLTQSCGRIVEYSTQKTDPTPYSYQRPLDFDCFRLCHTSANCIQQLGANISPRSECCRLERQHIRQPDQGISSLYCRWRYSQHSPCRNVKTGWNMSSRGEQTKSSH